MFPPAHIPYRLAYERAYYAALEEANSMSDPSQPVNTSAAAAFPPAAPPAGGAFPLPPPPAFPTAPPAFDGGAPPASAAYAYQGQAYLTPTQDALVAQTSGLAIASLVCSLAALGVVLFPPLILACIAGVICGHLALWRIGRSHGQLKGKGFAIAGLIIGYVLFALTLLGIVAIVLLVTPVGIHLFG